MLELIPLAASALSYFGQASDSISKLSDAATKLQDVASQQASLKLQKEMLELEKTLHAMGRKAFEVEKERDKLSDELNKLKEGKEKTQWIGSLLYRNPKGDAPICSHCYESEEKCITMTATFMRSASGIVGGPAPQPGARRTQTGWTCPHCKHGISIR